MRGRAAEVVGTAFSFIPDKQQAWADLYRLTEDTDYYVRSCAAEVLGAVYFLLSDKKPVWDDIHRLTNLIIEQRSSPNPTHQTNFKPNPTDEI